MNIQSLIDNLNNLVIVGKRFGSKVFIDEQKFFIGTAQIKKEIPEALKQLERAERENSRSLGTFVEIDKLEQMADQGYMHIFGQVLVDKQALLEQIERVRAALEQDVKRVR